MIEHIERVVGIKSADIDFATLGNMAIKSQVYAKALYYKEYEFRTNQQILLKIWSISIKLLINQMQQKGLS